MTLSAEFINIAAYKFVQLSDLQNRRSELRDFCSTLDLKGTILLTPEGINLFLAGSRGGVDSLLQQFRNDPLFCDLQVKKSISDYQPFNRMLVKIKKEIITFSVDGIEPTKWTSKKLRPDELKQWLDDGRPVTLLDVRNDYEVELGTFSGAIPIGIDHFRQFPEAVDQLPENLKEQPVVMFCTGGIRCEKAGPFMEQAGFKHVMQLDGGILKYFEDCGGDHYDGECFVFDQRVAVDSSLKETDTTQCFACQRPLSAEDQRSDKYVVGKSCAYCYQSPEETMIETIARRQAALKKLVHPLPGSVPYDNVRPMNVPQRLDRVTAIEFLDQMHPHIGRDNWRARCEQGRITRRDETLTFETEVRAGDRIEHLVPGTTEPDVITDIDIIYEDDCIVVVDKPAPLPMHPCGRFNRNTLIYFLNQIYKPLCLRMVHRLDSNTTGVTLFAKTSKIASILQPQFKFGQVKKEYLALVKGVPKWRETVCNASISNEAGIAGSRTVVDVGLECETRFRVLRSENDSTLIRATPITGRTNQIRIHLVHLGFPIVGDSTYETDGQIADRQTHRIEDPPLCLHATRIEFRHPQTGNRVQFEAKWPNWSF